MISIKSTLIPERVYEGFIDAIGIGYQKNIEECPHCCSKIDNPIPYIWAKFSDNEREHNCRGRLYLHGDDYSAKKIDDLMILAGGRGMRISDLIDRVNSLKDDEKPNAFFSVKDQIIDFY